MTSDVNRSIEEQLSAFLDDELRDEELDLLVRRLERNEEYRATLARYSLIANVVRNDPVHTYPNQFRAKLMAAIAAENSAAQPAGKELRMWSGWRAPVASAAVVAVVTFALASPAVQGWLSGSDPAAPPLANVSGLQLPGPADAELAASTGTGRSAVRRQTRLDPERLSSYIVSHREYAQSLHQPIANSRIVVQQARFEE